MNARLFSAFGLLLVLGATASSATHYFVGIGNPDEERGDCDVSPPDYRRPTDSQRSCFTPSQLIIIVGDSVSFFEYADDVITGPHNVVADDGSFRCARGCDGEGGDGTPVSDNICRRSTNGIETCTLTTGISFARTFTAPGIVQYHDEVSQAAGVIVVRGSAVPVVPYYNRDLDVAYYTADPEEIAKLGTRVGNTGWVLNNSLGMFLAWPSTATAPGNAVPVCRFYWPELAVHFFTAFAPECHALIAAGSPWVLETSSAFYVLLPDATTGSCAEGYLAVYRLVDGNDHYFASSFASRAEVLATTPRLQSEGYGPFGVAFCTPQS